MALGQRLARLDFLADVHEDASAGACWLVCSCRTSRQRTSDTPASIMVENWRQKMDSSVSLIFCRLSRKLPPPAFLALACLISWMMKPCSRRRRRQDFRVFGFRGAVAQDAAGVAHGICISCHGCAPSVRLTVAIACRKTVRASAGRFAPTARPAPACRAAGAGPSPSPGHHPLQFFDVLGARQGHLVADVALVVEVAQGLVGRDHADVGRGLDDGRQSGAPWPRGSGCGWRT